MSDLLFWVLSIALFLAAVASGAFAVLVSGHENRYLYWIASVAWAVLCLALALVLKARFL